MQKLRFFLSLLVSSIIFFVSCNSGPTGEAYTIKMRLNKGDTFNHNTRMNMQMNTAAMGQSVDMTMKMDAFVNFEVLNNTSGNKELKMTYTNLHMGMDMGKMNTANVNTDSIMNVSSKKMVGKSILMELSPTNEITGVKGFDSLMAANDNDEATRQLAEKMFSKDQMNNLFGMMFSMYPGKPVRVGETWTAKTKVNVANIDMKVNIKYTLVGVKNGLADIDVDGIIDGKGAMSTAGNAIDVAMSGTQKGMITLKMDDGYLQNGAYKMNIKADMEMMGQKIPMTMKADYTLSNK